MSKAVCNIRIGTSGWYYSHWAGLFYPADLPKSRWFQFYAKDFDTVEINNTFYRQPKPETFTNWHKQAPKNFLYTVKANRFITHIKRLKDAEKPLERFLEGALLLKENLGPILYQLPPSFHKDLDRLRSFLKILPKKQIAVFEFRHESWFSEDSYELLKEFNAGFCIHDMGGIETPRAVTGGIIYIRFHGPTGKYKGSYPESVLQNWVRWIKKQTGRAHTIYVYFNNDIQANAVRNAKQLKEQFRKHYLTK